jgi:phosphoglycerate dehydrogenase-like enzyme
MKKVVITSEFFGRFSDEGEQILKEAGYTVIPNSYRKGLNEAEVISIVSEANAIICDLEPITSKVIDSALHLKIISRRGVGVDSVDVEYAKANGITVARTLNVVEEPVAELVMAYIFQAYRKIDLLNSDMKKGVWRKILGSSLSGKTLGIIGLGNIARELIRKAQPFDMKIIYYDVLRKSDTEKELSVGYASFENLLAESDIISIHAPLLESTENMFNYASMQLMKKKPVLINTARGAIINESDLCRALDEELISFAAIDVFDTEPKTDSPLLKYENAILTPHVGTFTKETFIAMDVMAAQNIINYFEGC